MFPQEPEQIADESVLEEVPTEPEPLLEEEEKKEEEEVDEITGLPKDIVDAIIACADHYRKEDMGTRDTMIAFWKLLENYFQGFTRIFYDYANNDWARMPLDEDAEQAAFDDPRLYDKVVNIYRAHQESLISALSIKPPTVVFYPSDADVVEDIDTCKAANKIKALIERHNKSLLLIMRSLFILFNQGVVAAYIYNRSKKDYGTTRIPQYGEDKIYYDYIYNCPVCMYQLGNETSDQELPIPDSMNCPNCGALDVSPLVEVLKDVIPTITGFTEEPKARTIIDVFGPLWAHMPLYARDQETMPYIALNFEQHKALLIEHFPALRDKIGSNAQQDIDVLARSYNNMGSNVSMDLNTTTCIWLRPWAFNILDKEIADKCKTRFPNGCYATIINRDLLAEAHNESLDDCWEITVDPLSHYLHADPLGKILAPMQDIETEINDLTLETFQHSIPETFADPLVLDFDKYGKEDAKPGMIYKAKAPQGGSLADGFHTIKPATLSDELDVYSKRNEAKTQFVSGSFPSIFGGNQTTGSKTAAEYQESRASALQRLNKTWIILKYWYANLMGKAVNHYIDSLVEDDKIVERSDKSDNGFVNNWIRLSELSGRIGEVLPDVEEDLPISSAQLRALFIELITLNNEYLNEAMFAPENTPLMAKAMGVPDFYIPGKDSRDKQYGEITEILRGEPVEVDIDDDHIVEIKVIKSWKSSPAGLATKKMNRPGYDAVTMHENEHIMALQALTQQDNETPAGNKPPSATDDKVRS